MPGFRLHAMKRGDRMSRIRIAVVCAATASAAAWAASAVAAGTQLAVTPGLWEITSTNHTTGAPPIPPDALAKLSPDQRARFEAMMKAQQQNQGRTHVFKSCLTAEQLKRGFTLGPTNPQDKCQKTVVSSTSKVLEVHLECTGQDHAVGTFHYEALTPKTVAGKMDIVVTRGAQSMTVKNDMRGKWVAADCGNVKPGK